MQSTRLLKIKKNLKGLMINLMNQIHDLIKFKKENRVFIIAEAGSNWKASSSNSSLKRAKKLISIAANCGADAIKFQTFNPNLVYVPNAGKSNYLKKNGVNKSINEIFKENSMPYEMLPKLSNFCKEKKIMFMSTPFSVQDAKEIDPYVKVHKLASYEINHVRLLDYLASTKKPLLISTGAATYEEIDFAINRIKKKGSKNIVLLQCTSKYPASIELLNLKVITKLKKKYNLIAGLSDHSSDPIIGPVSAVGIGAEVIEKHFTLNRNLPGPDHPFALEPDELKQMISYIRKAENSLGGGEKEILAEEKELHNFATRSIQAIKNISKGDILREGENFEILRPGNRIRGLDARFLEQVQGKKAIKDIKIGDGVTDFE